ncbi:MAG: YicC/YloC family endoribonuclease [Eubacteriales bacterium]
MPKSMTGFGRGISEGEGYRFEIELKAVNHRFLETIVRSPRNLNFADEKLKKILQQKISRGRIEIYVNVKETEEKKRIAKLDKELALSYDKSLKELANSLNKEYDVDIFKLVSLPEVLVVEEPEADHEALWPVMETALLEALSELMEMRKIEGEKLCHDLNSKIAVLLNIIEAISKRAPFVVDEYKERLEERIAALAVDAVLDENRMAVEVAFFADRASIEEELVRLRSHIQQFEKALGSEESIGRKLDFLIQEMNREVNTIGSKANDLDIAQAVVDGKSELEKIREQVQNIE